MRLLLLQVMPRLPCAPPQSVAVEEHEKESHREEEQVLAERLPVRVKRVPFQERIDQRAA